MPTKPKAILIFRHAEKPGNPAADVDDDGIHLSPAGQIRAAALSVYIPTNFGKIDHLFASKLSRHSNRSVETITPLAKAIGLKIDSMHSDGDYSALAQAVLTDNRYADRTILICWHHTHIPDLASAFGIVKPPEWPGHVFDRIWMIDYHDGTAMLHNNPQMLLYGDSSV
jgi:hypothetical protein